MTAAAPLGAFVAQQSIGLRTSVAPPDPAESFEALLDPAPTTRPLQGRLQPDSSREGAPPDTALNSPTGSKSAPFETPPAAKSPAPARASLGALAAVNAAAGAQSSKAETQSESPERISDPKNVSVSPPVTWAAESTPPTLSSMQRPAPGEYRLPLSTAQPPFPYLPTQKTPVTQEIAGIAQETGSPSAEDIAGLALASRLPPPTSIVSVAVTDEGGTAAVLGFHAAGPAIELQLGAVLSQESKQEVEARTFGFPELGVFGIDLAPSDTVASGARISKVQTQSEPPGQISDLKNVSVSQAVIEADEQQSPLSSMHTAASGEYQLPLSTAQPSFPYLPTQKTAPGEDQLPLSIAQPSLPGPPEGAVELGAQLPVAIYRPSIPHDVRGVPIEQDPRPGEEDVAEPSSMGAAKLPPGNFEVRTRSPVAITVSDENGTLSIAARALGATADEVLGIRKLIETTAQEFNLKLGELRLNGVASQPSAEGGVLGSHSG